MIREDLISQMIRQIAALITRILKRNISQESVEEELNALSGKFIGLPSDLLLYLPPEETFRLFEESDRMIIEKSYFMGEFFRLKGINSESPEAQGDYYAKALFFYGKCSGKVSEKLQGSIDQTLEELRIAGHSEPYSGSEKGSKDATKAPDVQRRYSLPSSANRRKKRTSVILWYAIAACVIGMFVHSLFNEQEIEITNRIWGFEDGLAQAEFQIVNNTDQQRLIKLRFSVEHSSSKVFGSSHTFLGAAEREYKVAPQSAETFKEKFEYALSKPRANQTISIAMLSNESMDPTP